MKGITKNEILTIILKPHNNPNCLAEAIYNAIKPIQLPSKQKCDNCDREYAVCFCDEHNELIDEVIKLNGGGDE